MRTPQRHAASAPPSPTRLSRPSRLICGLWLVCVGISVLVPVACPFRAATGLDCPACGATRALESCGELRLQAALDHNAAAVVLGVAIALYLALAGMRWRVPPRVSASALGRRPLEVVLGLALGWAVLRNLPAFAWFASPSG